MRAFVAMYGVTVGYEPPGALAALYCGLETHSIDGPDVPLSYALHVPAAVALAVSCAEGREYVHRLNEVLRLLTQGRLSVERIEVIASAGASAMRAALTAAGSGAVAETPRRRR